MQEIPLTIALMGWIAVGCTLSQPQTPTVTSTSVEQQSSEPSRTKIPNSSFELQFPADWSPNDEDHPYDIQYFSALLNYV